MQVKFTITNYNPNTIYNKLCSKLGRLPTPKEEREEVSRILKEAVAELSAP